MGNRVAVQNFITCQMRVHRVRLHDMVDDLGESYGMVSHVINGQKKSPAIRRKVALYLGYETWEELETAAEEWAAYNMNSLPSGAPIASTRR